MSETPEKPAKLFTLANRRVPGERYEIVGRIEHVRFQSDDGSFVIATMRPQQGLSVTIKGALFGVEVDDQVRVEGPWEDSSYGPQLRVEAYEYLLPVTPEGITKFLTTQLKGVGPTLAERIVDKFGEETLRVMDEEIEQLHRVEGIGAKKFESIREEWEKRHGQRNTLIFLQSQGISMSMATRLMSAYGSEVGNIVKTRPYELARDVRGIGFLTADRIAQRLGWAVDSSERIDAGLTHTLHECESAYGHCFLYTQQLVDEAVKILGVDQVLVEKQIDEMLLSGRLVEEETEVGTALFKRSTWMTEVTIAEDVRRLFVSTIDESDLSEAALVEKIETALNLKLASQQRQAVIGALTGKMMVVTGGPGTGKTTLVRVVVEACNRLKWDVALAAPTGRAAKRLAEATGKDAKTIHRLLEFSFQAGGFQRNIDNPLPSAVYVIDETSMIDIYLMKALLDALPDDARLVLVGDVDQLPSVGPGTVLKDFIDSGVVPVVRLTEVFRQASESMIVRNAHLVNHGQMPVLPEVKEGELVDYYAVNAFDGAQAEALIEKLVCERIPQAFGLDPMKDIQVLSPMRSKPGGVEPINRALQARLNPDGEPIGTREDALRVGDRVMQLRNNYDKDIFNGDVGRIVTYSKREKAISVEFDGRLVVYSPSELDELSLAYACTVHKAQGSEYPAVVIPLLRSHHMLLQRNLLYTALTRARRLAFLVCDPNALKRAVGNAQPSARNTRLAQRLQKVV